MVKLYSNRDFDSVPVSDVMITRVDDDRAFLVWDNGGRLCFRAVEANNNYSTFSSLVLSSTVPQSTPSVDEIIAVCLIATDKVAIAYQSSSDADFYVIVCTLSDLEVTAGTPQKINNTDNIVSGLSISLCSPDTDKVVFMFTVTADAATYNVNQRAATVSGTVATFGTETTVSTGTSSAVYEGYQIQKISTDKVVYSYVKSDNIRYLRCRTLTGTTFNAEGTEITQSGSSTSDYRSQMMFIATDKVYHALARTGSSTTNFVFIDVITASGTTLTLTASNQIGLPNPTNGFSRGVNLIYFTAEKMAVTAVTSDLKQYIAMLTVVSDSAITTDDYILLATASGNLDIYGVGINAELALIAYSDTSKGILSLLPLTPFFSLDEKRDVAQSLLVSWKKDFLPSITFFTIGVSTIGGNDIISPTEHIDSQWNKYFYFDESDYVEQLEWEHSLSMPMGGISVGMAAGSLDNTSGRFTPRYMGGTSELFTAVLPRRPFIINAGFESEGVEHTSPQFVGLFNKQPMVDTRSKRVDFSGVDFVNFLQNRYVDDEAIFTGQRSDQLIERILQSQGFTTAQYDLDVGINIINFAIFKRGERFGQIIDEIAKAEYAQFYQNHQGVLKFENRQHWDNDTEVDYLLLTSQVLEAKAPDIDHIVNVVEIKSDVRGKQPEQTIFRLATFNSIEIAASGTTEVFIDFENPALSMTTPTSSSTTSFYVANSESDGSGTNVSSSVTITKVDKFSNAAKIIFSNSSGNVAYITELVVTGRTAPVLKNIYYRSQDDSSVTAYEERPQLIQNNYIQDETWAMSYAEMVLTDFAEPENLIDLRIRAIPELALGDLVSWQGRHWRVFSKSSILNAGQGFVQDIKLLRRDVTNYFRIGISTIGSSDKIAP